MILLQQEPTALPDATPPTPLPSRITIPDRDGLHHLVDVGGKRRLQILQSDDDATALVAIVPLGHDGFARLDAVYRLLAMIHGRAVPADKRLTRQKRLRAKRMLRAHDGRLAGASQREIAEVIFKMPVISRDEWQSASQRFAVMALLRDARRMVDGGYLTLLRPRERG